MFHRFACTLFAALVATPLFAQDASTTVVWGMTFQSGYGTGEVSITDLDDTYVMTFEGGISRPCEAVLSASADGAFAPVITNENVRGCDRLTRVVFRDQEDDILPVEITRRDKTQVYPLRLRNSAQAAGTFPDGLDIQGAMLGAPLDEVKGVLAGLGDMTESVGVFGRDRQNLGYSYQQSDGSNIYMAMGDSLPLGEGGAVDRDALSAMPVVALARFWQPGSDARPNLDTMRGALFGKYGEPSIQIEEDRYAIYEWQYDVAGDKMPRSAALGCSAVEQDESKISYSTQVSTGFSDRRRRPYILTIRGALLPCNVSLRVRLDLIESYTVASMEQTIWRHGEYLRDKLDDTTRAANRIVGITGTSQEQEAEAPDL